MGGEGDPYLGAIQISFDTRNHLDRYVEALQRVIDRHDILRTGVVWQGLSDPVQVVWRKATLPVQEVVLDLAEGDVAEQLYERFNPRKFRIDVREAPLMRVVIAHDANKGRWLMMRMSHHLVEDATSLRIILRELQAHLRGEMDALREPVPFRNFVAQAHLGTGDEGHEAFSAKCLAM